MNPLPEISVIFPVKNESLNIIPLINSIINAMEVFGRYYEIIMIDDHSTDNSADEFNKFSFDKPLRFLTSKNVFKLADKYGKSYSLQLGYEKAQGNLIATLDADLQNDPQDIPLLIQKLKNDNLDFIGGIRVNRNDNFSRRISSKIANHIRNMITKDNIKDAGCGLMLIKKECTKHLIPFEPMLYKRAYLFTPTLLKMLGFKTGEMQVNHHQRLYGKPKYNAVRGRTWKGLLACLKVRKLKQQDWKSSNKI